MVKFVLAIGSEMACILLPPTFQHSTIPLFHAGGKNLESKKMNSYRYVK